MQSWLFLVPLFPLLGFAVNGLIGARLHRTTVSLVAIAAVAASFAVSVGLFVHLAGHPKEPLHQVLYVWLGVGELGIDAGLLVDELTSVMLLVITGVGLLIHVYSHGYMHHDPAYARFFAYLNLFVFAMLLLVLGDNLAVLFVGWEGVGLCSYLLIGFWYQNPDFAAAGRKAFVVNRIGDFGFVVGMLVLFMFTHTLSYAGLAARYNTLPEWAVTLAALALFLGATGKSAQIPLFVWLPDAMAGPTPVSALIHAATMVTAGVYMVARLGFIFLRSPTAMLVIAVIGAATLLLAGSIGLAQREIKKVLAYSTVSQLGYMMLAVGVGAFSAGIFHVVTHAFFKACLFLGAGCVMHALHDEQDILRMGGLMKKMPATALAMGAATLALLGFPLTSGFFSKDEILWEAFASPAGHPLLYAAGLAGAAMTGLYAARLWALVFAGKSRMPDAKVYEHARDQHWTMTYPVVALGLLAVVAGVLGLPEGLGFHNYFHDFLAETVSYDLTAAESAHHLELPLMLVSGVLAACVGYAGYWLFRDGPGSLATRLAGQKPWCYLHRALVRKWWVDEIYDAAIVQPVKGLAYGLWKVVDETLIDRLILGVVVGGTARYGGLLVRWLQSGVTQRYAAVFVVGAAVVLGYLAAVAGGW